MVGGFVLVLVDRRTAEEEEAINRINDHIKMHPKKSGFPSNQTKEKLTGRTTADRSRVGHTSLALCSPRRSLVSCTPERLFSAAMAVRLPTVQPDKESNRLVLGRQFEIDGFYLEVLT